MTAFLTETKKVIYGAGKIAAEHFEHLQRVDVKEKSRFERVTTVDRTIHRFLKKQLPTIYKAPVLSEENSMRWKPCSTYWVVDPIDGTTNYITRIPFFCIGIGLVVDHVIVFNAIYNPILNELFTAQKNKGAFLNGKKLRADHKLPLSKSIIGISYSHSQSSIEHAGRIGLRLRRTVHNTRHAGSTLLTFAYVAAGRLEASVAIGPVTAWDTIPSLLLVQEVHGRITDFSGKPYRIEKTKNIIASNGTDHSRLQHIISATR